MSSLAKGLHAEKHVFDLSLLEVIVVWRYQDENKLASARKNYVWPRSYKRRKVLKSQWIDMRHSHADPVGAWEVLIPRT